MLEGDKPRNGTYPLFLSSAIKNFYDRNTGNNAFKGNESKICPSQYLGVLGCGAFAPGGVAGLVREPIPGDQQIPGMPVNPDLMPQDQMYTALKAALAAAEDLVKKLCENRRKFCDDGTPERYRCGASNQRCDSVKINFLLTTRVKKVLGQTKEGRALLGEITKVMKKTDCLAK